MVGNESCMKTGMHTAHDSKEGFSKPVRIEVSGLCMLVLIKVSSTCHHGLKTWKNAFSSGLQEKEKGSRENSPIRCLHSQKRLTG